MVVILIYGARSIFYYFVITKTLNLSSMKWKLVWMDQYYHIKKHISLYRTTIFIHNNMGEKLVVIFHIYGARFIFQLFCDHQDSTSD